MKYLEYFGMKRCPFGDDIEAKNLLALPGTTAVKSRIDYVLGIGGVMVVTGDVGSGKSTSMRWSLAQYHKSEVNSFYITANSGSSNELYRQLCWSMNIEVKSGSKSFLLRVFKKAIGEILESNKNKTLIIIDEASLLRTDIFSELHTINQFHFDSQKKFALVLVGLETLLDKLKYRTSIPFASRVMAKSHLPTLNEKEMEEYITHRLKYSGVNKNMFTKNALLAVWQGSGGLFRKANFLSRGALVACFNEKGDQVTEEHVRVASTELL